MKIKQQRDTQHAWLLLLKILVFFTSSKSKTNPFFFPFFSFQISLYFIHMKTTYICLKQVVLHTYCLLLLAVCVCLLVKYLLNHWTEFDETFIVTIQWITDQPHWSAHIKNILIANQPYGSNIKVNTIWLWVSFRYIVLNFGVIVSPTHTVLQTPNYHMKTLFKS